MRLIRITTTTTITTTPTASIVHNHTGYNGTKARCGHVKNTNGHVFEFIVIKSLLLRGEIERGIIEAIYSGLRRLLYTTT